MRSARWLVGVAAIAGGLALSAGAAGAQVGAQVEASGGTTCCDTPPPPTVPPTTTPTTAPSTTVPGRPTTTVVGAPGAVEPAAEQAAPAVVEPISLTATAPKGSLPLTGGDVAELALLGGVAIVTGTVLVRRGRVRTSD
jgi:hypothetical protein